MDRPPSDEHPPSDALCVVRSAAGCVCSLSFTTIRFLSLVWLTFGRLNWLGSPGRSDSSTDEKTPGVRSLPGRPSVFSFTSHSLPFLKHSKLATISSDGGVLFFELLLLCFLNVGRQRSDGFRALLIVSGRSGNERRNVWTQNAFPLPFCPNVVCAAVHVCSSP
ncbi:hypothetical protein BXZ70DRAFT_633636 [Cristinia sonorae]|uniref:Uncharacterized protein n=1 Tax=Cristinia sonorae TaxID=1940300 RepID=A0A8K0UGK6_9AGAR|nr:hypothetical protein BXZ70DRAFT_633636 [Cristinia sonorae]